MSELKPCPFCSASAEEWFDQPEDLYKVLIEHNPTCPLVDVMFEYTERHTLYEKWNTRADDWQPIETAPKDGTIIVAIRENGCGYDLPVLVKRTVKYPEYPWEEVHGENAYPDGRLDYWMPLPEPPQETTNEDN